MMNLQRGYSLVNYPAPRDEWRGHIVLVGECPSPGWDGRADHILLGQAFCGVPGKPGHLANLAGLNFASYLEIFDRVNVLEEHVSKWGKHHERRAAGQVKKILEAAEDRPILVLGRQASNSMGIERNTPFLSVVGNIYVFPHPSARNRWWHNLTHVRDAKTFIRKLVRSVHPKYA